MKIQEIDEKIREISPIMICVSPVYISATKSLPAAFLLAQIIFHYKNWNGEFFHTNEQFMEELQITKETMKRAKKEIAEIPFLQIIKKGTPPRTYYSLDLEKMEIFLNKLNCINSIQCINGVNGGKSHRLNGGKTHRLNGVESHHIYNKINNNKINTMSGAPGHVKNNDPTIDDPWYKLSLKYRNSIPKKLYPEPNIKSWSTMLKTFVKKMGRPKRIKNVLRWYSTQFDKTQYSGRTQFLPEFIPQAISMKSFCEKYSRIEPKYLEWKESIKNHKTKKHTENYNLSITEKKYFSTMKERLKNIKDVNMDELPFLIRSLNQHLQRSIKVLEKSFRNEEDRKSYIKHIFNSTCYFVDYALWIDNETRRWDGWSGTLKIFTPEGKHFQRFFTQLFKSKNIPLDARLKELL